MKILHITLSNGERNEIAENGRITRRRMNGNGEDWQGSPDWIFLGFSTHHQSNRITLPLAAVFADPSKLNVGKGRKLIGWDRDHGTLRSWGLPSIVSARVEEVADARADWARWLRNYGAEKFFDAFVRNAQGARGTCVYCGEAIYLDIVEGGGVPDWGIDGDYGCIESPESDEEGCGGHKAVAR